MAFLNSEGMVADIDQNGQFPETVIGIPWGVNPIVSWIDYQCWIDVDLDSGMVLHKPLPQHNDAIDDLANVFINDPNADAFSGRGLNLQSQSSGNDVVQRMATSTYTFTLKGYGLRAGYQVPIPGIRQIGASPVTPERQRAFNVIVGNWAGIPIWFATWNITYIMAGTLVASSGSLQQNPEVPFNLALKIRPDAKLPDVISFPLTPTDSRSMAAPSQQSSLSTAPGT